MISDMELYEIVERANIASEGVGTITDKLVEAALLSMNEIQDETLEQYMARRKR